MSEPRLTLQAVADLEDLWTYIAAWNPDAADRMVDALLASSRMHARFPGMGQGREDPRPGLRCFVVSPYVGFYRIVEDTIEVLRISTEHATSAASSTRKLDVCTPLSCIRKHATPDKSNRRMQIFRRMKSDWSRSQSARRYVEIYDDLHQRRLPEPAPAPPRPRWPDAP